MDQSKPSYLTWGPPDWSHRHGPFLAYEVKCWQNNSTMDAPQNSVGDKFTSINLTLDAGHVQWPGNAPLKGRSLIAWPSGRVALQSLTHLDSSSLGRSARVVCLVRGQTTYGFGPWSPATTVLPRRTGKLSHENSKAVFHRKSSVGELVQIVCGGINLGRTKRFDLLITWSISFKGLAVGQSLNNRQCKIPNLLSILSAMDNYFSFHDCTSLICSDGQIRTRTERLRRLKWSY